MWFFGEATSINAGFVGSSKTSVKCNFTPEIFKSDLGVLLIIFVAYCKNVNRNGNDGMKNGFKIFHTSFQQKFLTSFCRYFYIF